LQPFAYGLRDHKIFDSPLKIDRTKTTEVPVPTAWAHEIPGDSVEVLPLVDDQDLKHSPGWCSYLYRHAESPELELLCGGINAKTAKAAGLWRQGNLLHFGFEQSPTELNDAGRALLINSVAYIARFNEDRPITDVTSPFVGPAPQDRGAILRAFTRSDLGLPYLKRIVAEPLYEDLETLTIDERLAWYRKYEGYLHADENGKLLIDEEALAIGVPPNIAKFFDKTLAALKNNNSAAAEARGLLVRYAPDGPGEEGSAAAWRSWWQENKPYLFFSDSGGYRWYIDPLAKKRAVPTAKLRGPARADLPKARNGKGKP
jgi:hypothetical protein